MIQALQGLLAQFQRERHRDEDREDAALMAIYVAAQETRLYIDRLRRCQAPDREAEEELARLWQKAAVPIRHFDPDLAERCMGKADYWLNPEAWSEEDIRANRIEIDRVYRQARNMLTGPALARPFGRRQRSWRR